MPASIRTTLHSSPGGPIVGPILASQSRDDLMKGYQVVCESVNFATTYSWSLAFAPYSSGPVTGSGDNFGGTPSGASLLPPEGSTSQSCKFNVDWDGAYLIRLVVDAGLPTEATQFVRLRNLTTFGELKLVAAGERRDQNGTVPVDATPEGWARDQNQNLQRLLALARRTATSARVLYVDSNRGRDNAATPDDPTNFVRFPGPDPTARDESGVRYRAVGFGDFSSINEAIAYAMDAPARGEPPVSQSNPCAIVIQPGVYEETLNLQPWVFLLGALEQPPPLPISDTILGGVYILGGNHTYSASGGFTDICLLQNVAFHQPDASTDPVIRQTGSNILLLTGTTVLAGGAHVNQGPALLIESDDPIATGIHRSTVVSKNAPAVDDFAIVQDAPSTLWVSESVVSGRSGILSNPNLKVSVLLDPGQLFITRSHIDAEDGVSLAGFPGHCSVNHTMLMDSGSGTTTIDFAQAAIGACAYEQNTEIAFSYLTNDIRYEAGITTGQAELKLGGNSSLGEVIFPMAPVHQPTVFMAYGDAFSHRYTPDFVRPETGPAGAATVPAGKRLPVKHVQDALDWLVNIAMPASASPFYSLNTAYDGLATLSPLVYGSGLGRTIVADAGAVRITGATAPMWAETDGLLRGGLQIEGRVDVGPLVSDGLGSEIVLDPNPFGVGPRVDLGRQVWPNGITTPRGLPSATVMAGKYTAGPSTRPYSLTLGTRSLLASSTGKMGHVLVVAGGSAGGASHAGSLHLQGGPASAGVGNPGAVWLAPGGKAGADPGRVWVANPNSALPFGAGVCTLLAANPYNAGSPVTGTFYVATVNGMEGFTVTPGMTLNALVILINSTSTAIHAVNIAGRLYLFGYPHGPVGDVYYVGDTVGGALNTKLGDLSLPAATFTPGSWPESISFACIGPDQIHFYGTVTADAGLGPGSAGDVYSYHFVPAASLTYPVAGGIRLVGVDTSGGVTLVQLPAAGAGRVITVKDETGNAPANPITLQSVVPGVFIDGAPFAQINTARGSLSVYYSGNPARGWMIY